MWFVREMEEICLDLTMRAGGNRISRERFCAVCSSKATILTESIPVWLASKRARTLPHRTRDITDAALKVFHSLLRCSGTASADVRGATRECPILPPGGGNLAVAAPSGLYSTVAMPVGITAKLTSSTREVPDFYRPMSDS
jgi:hypothetical protein